jgi:hypothetical protein
LELVAVVARLVAGDDTVAAGGRADGRVARALEAGLDRARRRAPITAGRVAVVARFRGSDDAVTAAPRQVLGDRVVACADRIVGRRSIPRHRARSLRLGFRELRQELVSAFCRQSTLTAVCASTAFALHLDIAANRWPVAVIFAATHLATGSAPAAGGAVQGRRAARGMRNARERASKFAS